jgi:phosphate/sulfate permease
MVWVWFMVFNATFQQYFSYVVAVSFICGGNRRTFVDNCFCLFVTFVWSLYCLSLFALWLLTTPIFKRFISWILAIVPASLVAPVCYLLQIQWYVMSEERTRTTNRTDWWSSVVQIFPNGLQLGTHGSVDSLSQP